MKKISTKSIVALVLLAVAIAFSLWYFNAPAGQGSLRLRLGAPKDNYGSSARTRYLVAECKRQCDSIGADSATTDMCKGSCDLIDFGK